jgi:hypothetical protein
LKLAKLQSQILGGKSEDETQSNGSGITEDDKNLLRELFKEKSNNKNTEYDID